MDGVRAFKYNGQLYTREGNPIPNHEIQNKSLSIPEGSDGELYLHGLKFEDIQSYVMSKDAKGEDITLHIFDNFLDRSLLPEPYEALNTHVPLAKDIEDRLLRYLESGYEGLIFRNVSFDYCFGRSSKDNLELVRFKTSKEYTGRCIGFIEELTLDRQPKDRLGSLIVVTENGITFRVSAGLTSKHKEDIWQNKSMFFDKEIVYSCQNLTKYGVPRFPIFKHFKLDR